MQVDGQCQLCGSLGSLMCAYFSHVARYWNPILLHITPHRTIQYPTAIVKFAALLGFRCVFTCPILLHIISHITLYYSMQFHTITYGYCLVCSALGSSVSILQNTYIKSGMKKLQPHSKSPHPMSHITLLSIWWRSGAFGVLKKKKLAYPQNRLHSMSHITPLSTLWRFWVFGVYSQRLSPSFSIFCPTLLDSYLISRHQTMCKPIHV